MPKQRSEEPFANFGATANIQTLQRRDLYVGFSELSVRHARHFPAKKPAKYRSGALLADSGQSWNSLKLPTNFCSDSWVHTGFAMWAKGGTTPLSFCNVRYPSLS